MIGPLLAQVLGSVAASRRQLIGPIVTKLVLVLIGGILLIAGLAFVLVAIYHALAPVELTPVEAAGVIALALLVMGGIVVLVALKGNFRPSPPPAALGKPDFQSAELTAIEALGMLNRALTDLGKGRGGTTPYLGLLGIAALVGFISGRKR
jgi:hypothetical protein